MTRGRRRNDAGRSVARVAGWKGHSFFLYFLLSLVFFPLALILAYVAKDKAAY